MVIRTFVFDYESDVDLFSFLLETSCQLFLGFSIYVGLVFINNGLAEV